MDNTSDKTEDEMRGENNFPSTAPTTEISMESKSLEDIKVTEDQIYMSIDETPMVEETTEDEVRNDKELKEDILEIIDDVFNKALYDESSDFDLSIFSRIRNLSDRVAMDDKTRFADSIVEESGIEIKRPRTSSMKLQPIEVTRGDINNSVKPEGGKSKRTRKNKSEHGTLDEIFSKFPEVTFGLNADALEELSVLEKEGKKLKKEGEEDPLLSLSLDSPLMNVISLFASLDHSILEKEETEK